MKRFVTAVCIVVSAFFLAITIKYHDWGFAAAFGGVCVLGVILFIRRGK